jgi:hypothetical protein
MGLRVFLDPSPPPPPIVNSAPIIQILEVMNCIRTYQDVSVEEFVYLFNKQNSSNSNVTDTIRRYRLYMQVMFLLPQLAKSF